MAYGKGYSKGKMGMKKSAGAKMSPRKQMAMGKAPKKAASKGMKKKGY